MARQEIVGEGCNMVGFCVGLVVIGSVRRGLTRAGTAQGKAQQAQAVVLRL